jgi:hypothetical protein
MKYVRPIAVLIAFAVAVPAHAADLDAKLVTKARNYVESDKFSKDIVTLMHMGATYKGCKATDIFKVTANGQEVPGALGVTVRVYWAFSAGDNDHTDVDYYFNANGRFLKLTPTETTALFSQPFLATGLVVEAFKQALLDNLRGKHDEDTWAPIIKEANAKRLVEIAVQLNQP